MFVIHDTVITLDKHQVQLQSNEGGLRIVDKDRTIDGSELTTQGNTFNGSSQLVQMTTDGKLPAVDGSLLTNLPGGSASSGEALVMKITKAGHGFITADVTNHVALTASLTKAKADTEANVETIGVLVGITGDELSIQHTGKLTWTAHGFTGPVVALSDVTAGAYMETNPASGHFLKTLLKVIDVNTVEVVDYAAVEVGVVQTTYSKTFIDSDLSSGVLTVTHSLNSQYGYVVVTDNTNKIIYPDDVVFTDASTLSVDLTSFGTLTGNWRMLYMTFAQDVHQTVFSNSDLDSGSVKFINVTHNLNSPYVMPTLIDNNNKVAMPDYFTFTSDNILQVDLTTLAPITGNWRVLVRR